MGSKSRLLATIAAAVAVVMSLAFAVSAHAVVISSYDTFTEFTNGTLLENHVGETGASWTRHPSFSTTPLTIDNERVWGSQGGLYYASGVPPTNEYSVLAQLTVMSNSGSTGVVARASTTSADYYRGGYNAASGKWELVKCISNVCTVLASSPAVLADGTVYQIQLQMLNSQKTLYVYGVPVATSADNSITQTGRAGIRTGPGIVTGTTGYQVDEFEVYSETDTTITAGPSGATNNASPSFSFTSTPSGGTFECKLDGPGATVGTWGACSSPKAYSALADGSYTFSARATVSGITDASPATRSFTVDTTAPQTTIDSGPTGTITTNSASFGFSSEATATFQCKLDGPGTTTGTYGSCTSPKAYSSLANGSYTFSVRATDAVGNVDATPATRAFTVSVAAGCTPNLGQLTVSGCTLVKADNGSAADPKPLWGSIDCVTAAQASQITTGGDTHPTGDGSAQGDTAYRRMHVNEGDNFYGERCELGRNDHRSTVTPATFNLYREGEHRITFLSLRLPSGFPLSTTTWQVVSQMKQTQPSDNGDGTPVLALHAEAGQWKLFQSSSVLLSSNTTELWGVNATKSQWTRFAFDVKYSQNNTIGSVKVYIDLNGDGDALDPGEQQTTPTANTYTLKQEIAGTTTDGMNTGDSLPSHLRVGLYHNNATSGTGSIDCVVNDCSVEVDNVQVYQAP